MSERQQNERRDSVPDRAGDEDLAAEARPHVGAKLEPRLDAMGQTSLFNLITGLRALGLPGVSGHLIIEVPLAKDGRVEVDWTPTPPRT